VGPDLIAKPALIVTDDTLSAELPVLDSLIWVCVLSVLRRTSPNATDVGETSALIGGGSPVPVSVIDLTFMLPSELSVSRTLTTQLTWPATRGWKNVSNV